MRAEFSPSLLQGTVAAIPSKSMSHRLLICAALAKGRSVIRNLAFSQDIRATIASLKALGAKIDCTGSTAVVDGITTSPDHAVLPCHESGSTLRFLIPIAAALGVTAEFHGAGKLPSRPITPYVEQLPCHGIRLDYHGTMPFSISGGLTGGDFVIDGGISSQFLSGLLFALPLLLQESRIKIKGWLESRPYVAMTLAALEQYGITVTETADGYLIPGGQAYTPCDATVEGDYSQAAFFLTAGAIGAPVTVTGLNPDSTQGDRAILSILKECGAKVTAEDHAVTVSPAPLSAFTVSVRDIPDLVPILTVLAAFCSGVSHITDAARLRIKESDRLAAMTECMSALGGKVTASPDALSITGVPALLGGKTDSWNDHRIAMSAAIAATRCKETVVLTGAESVEKSYPDFYRDYKALGGVVNVLDLDARN